MYLCNLKLFYTFEFDFSAHEKLRKKNIFLSNELMFEPL